MKPITQRVELITGPKPVIVESPFEGETERNILYAQRACLVCLDLGEAPFASHLLYTQLLDDENPAERRVGIRAGYAWWNAAEAVIFFEDYGMSPGMVKARERAFAANKTIIHRRIGKNPDETLKTVQRILEEVGPR